MGGGGGPAGGAAPGPGGEGGAAGVLGAELLGQCRVRGPDAPRAPGPAGDAGDAPRAPGPAGDRLTALPALLLEELLARGIRDPRDAAAVAGTCGRLRAAVRAAPLRLRVAPSLGSLIGRGDDRYLKAVAERFPNTAALEILEAHVSDADISEALGALPGLRALHVQSCHKIGGRLGQALTAAPPSACPAHVSIVQCFRMTWTLLGALLRVNFRPGSALRCAAVSHLDLRALGIGRDGLLEVCEEGGGGGVESREGVREGAQGQPSPEGGSLRGLGLTNCNQLEPRLLRSMVVRLPRLEALFLGGTMLGDETGRFVCGFEALSEVVRLLPRLRVLELTFFPIETVAATRAAAAAEAHRPMVWDFSEAESVERAASFLRDLEVDEPSRATARGRPTPWALRPEDWRGLARSAASCSSWRQLRPMHLSAEQGSRRAVLQLLGLGAPADAKDRSGATPLFRAAFMGHCEVARALLEGGANCMALNAAEESPLYIAALRGHLPVVRAVVAHCAAAGIRWWENHRYGDGWNPLMAAVVGSQQAVVSELLAEGAAAGALVRATNRYGQTALHIASRSGSEALVEVLLAAGSDPAVKDTYGNSPLNVALRKGHGHLRALLALPARAPASGSERDKRERHATSTGGGRVGDPLSDE